MRPRVSRPTGTLMALPVSVTGVPRLRPSVEAMAMQRTVLSPTCCATSTVRVRFPTGMVRALSMAGRCPSGKRTSTTGPMTCETLPIAVSSIVFSPYQMSLPATTSVISWVMAPWRARL